MANMTFKTNILPNSDFGYSLGSSTNPQARWNVYGNLTGNADTATKLGTANKGSSMQPIYLSAGAPTECTIPSNGAWWSAIPQILQDGVMEIGKYIDFHTTSNGTTDYDVRITADTTGLTISGTTVGTFSGNLNGTASIATQLGTETKGSKTKPIFLSTGTPTVCSTYAGGTKVTLNGTSKGASTASFYAPIDKGTSGYILKSNGSDAPTWLQTLPIANGGTGATSAADAPWVRKSGDTMTGDLTINRTTNGSLLLSSTANNKTCGIGFFTTADNSYASIYTKWTGETSGTNILSVNSKHQIFKLVDIAIGTNGAKVCVVDNQNNNHSMTIGTYTSGQGRGIGAYCSGYINTSGTFQSSNKWLFYRRPNDGQLQMGLEVYASKFHGTVSANDYAEMRNVPEAQIENNPLRPGTCVCEIGDGTMVATTERLQRGCKVISDTFGFNIGETEDCKTSIAVSGRVLVYLDQDREIARDYIGWPVCSGPNGTVSIMTEEEEEKYPSRIVGTISEIPDYEKWGSSDVEVNGRIWIYVR